jgi:hypothetical protein
MSAPISSRETLLHLLAEASELEHNLLCSYLFALFSLKTRRDEDLTAEEFDAVQRWRKSLLGVCIEEMIHLAQVANITVAIGSRPHLNRPNLPVADGYHPASVVVELQRFDLDTLEHFIDLERPEGSPVCDGASSRPAEARVRRPHVGRLMPSAPHYQTIGEFYQVLIDGLTAYAGKFGEERLFIGPRELQMRPEEAGSSSLRVVSTLADARGAVEDIVRQGEGAPSESEDSHFAQFRRIRVEYAELVSRRPSFQPARNVGANPVMHLPVAHARTHVTHPSASTVLDAANGLYGFMLRCLAQSYETRWEPPAAREGIVGAAFRTMHAFAGVASELTSMPAREDGDGVRAGVSFAMMRSTEGLAPEASGAALVERLEEVRRVAAQLPLDEQFTGKLELDLQRVAESLAAFAGAGAGGMNLSAELRSGTAC